jgi:hypothetical protein
MTIKTSDELKKRKQGEGETESEKAAGKMKAMAKKMEEGLQGSEKEQMEEDVKMLRQVLDNLLAFLYRRNMRWYNSRSQKRFSGFQ